MHSRTRTGTNSPQLSLAISVQYFITKIFLYHEQHSLGKLFKLPDPKVAPENPGLNAEFKNIIKLEPNVKVGLSPLKKLLWLKLSNGRWTNGTFLTKYSSMCQNLLPHDSLKNIFSEKSYLNF